MSDETKDVESSETGAEPTATDSHDEANAANESGATPSSTVETQTVEEANAAYTGTTAEEQTSDDELPAGTAGGSSDDGEAESNELDVDKAPAFQQPAPTPHPLQIDLPDDPDGSKLLMLARHVLQTLIPVERSGAIHDLLTKVAADDALLRATSVVLRRVLVHEKANTVTVRAGRDCTLKVLGDVLQGQEPEHFAEKGLGEIDLCELFQHITPAA